MHASRRTAQILLSLCLIVFQAQLLAASLLGCQHAPSRSDTGIEVGCPLHAADSTQDGSGGSNSLLDCPKCALQCAVGAYATFATTVEFMPAVRPGQSASVPAPHFYRFTPEADFRPPITRLL